MGSIGSLQTTDDMIGGIHLPNYTTNLNIEKPLGTENFRRQTFNDAMDKIDGEVATLRAKIQTAVGDLTALKAINTSTVQDMTIILVESLGLYRFDATNTAPGDNNLIVQPTAGNGRWIKMSEAAVCYAANMAANDSYTVTIPGITAYYTGLEITFKTGVANTTACTLNVNGLGARTIKKNISGDLETGDIVAGQIITVVYDGINFQITSNLGGSTTAQSTQTLLNKTLTAPKLESGGYIADTNGNELIKFPLAVSSAVNEITVSNAISAGAPSIAASGSSTNIDLNLIPKGTGRLKENGVAVVKTDDSRFDTYNELVNRIENGISQQLNLTWGMNTFRNNGSTPTFPYMRIKGKHYVNLLGKDGNCEDVSKWSTYQSTLSLNPTKKIFGTNCIKVTTASIYGDMLKSFSSLGLSNSKYYLLTAYIASGNASGIVGIMYPGGSGSGGNVKYSVAVSSTTMSRILIRFSPSDWGTYTDGYITFRVDGAVSQYAYVDGVMLNEISAADSALSDARILEKYPYIDSYGALTNPYLENRRYNLIRNGNAEEGLNYWTPYSSIVKLSIESSKFRIDGGACFYQIIRVKANTNYYISANITTGSVAGNIQVVDNPINQTLLRYGVGTFNTGNNDSVCVYILPTTAGYAYFDSIMLIEGTTVPTSYKSCEIERFMLEGQFTEDDTVIIKDGKVSGTLNWKHKTLYGKDYDWQFGADFTGLKRISLSNFQKYTAEHFIGIKYDGKPLISNMGSLTTENMCGNGSTLTDILLTILDADTGWAEDMNPKADEVKAFMNGWKAVYNNGTRYGAWVSVVDNTPPAGSINIKVTLGATSATQVIAGTGTNLVNGDVVIQVRNGIPIEALTVSSSTANAITFSTIATTQTEDVFIKCDNGSTNVSLLTWCKNNIAPNYEGYKLHYKLANPEAITNINLPVCGNLWSLQSGDNYVTVDSGIVLGEVANPIIDGSYANLNDIRYPDLLKNKTEKINSICKNQVYDGLWAFDSAATSYGNQRGYIFTTNYDSNATYTVDYQILKALHAQSAAEMYIEFTQDIVSSVQSVAKAVEGRQQKSNVLDTLIDLSVYEEMHIYLTGRFTNVNLSTLQLECIVYYTNKRAMPVFTIEPGYIVYYLNGTTLVAIPPDSIRLQCVAISKSAMRLIILYTGTDSTIRTALLNNGGGTVYPVKITADCKGRI